MQVMRNTVQRVALSFGRSVVRLNQSGSLAPMRTIASDTSTTSTWTHPTWEVRVLYDGDCPLCVREVNFLRAKDEGRGKLDLVDVASPEYDPDNNRGISFKNAMGIIHGITPGGDVITGIEVFSRAYTAVGLGWMYSFTKIPALDAIATSVYNFWAERRLAVTGRPSIEEVLEARRKREAADGKTACAQGEIRR